MKTESNFIDHGPQYPIKPIKLRGNTKMANEYLFTNNIKYQLLTR